MSTLNPRAEKWAGDLPVAAKWAERIDVPLKAWYGQCHGVSLEIVRTGGRDRRRAWRAARHEVCLVSTRGSRWATRTTPKVKIIDPTLWCYVDDVPDVR